MAISRPGFIALAIVALTLLVTRPVCDALVSHASGVPLASASASESARPAADERWIGDSAVCCAMVEFGTLVKTGETSVPTAFWSGAMLIAASFVLRRSGLFNPRAAVLNGGAPPKPFYLRSARILR